MNQPAVYSFVGYSNSGKTTFIEQLIPILKEQGIRLAIIKHDAHDFEIDREGKDSWRFTKAGADISAVVSANKAAVIERRSLTLDEVIARMQQVDLILTEGYKQERYPKIAVYRASREQSPVLPLDQCVAVVSDLPQEGATPSFLLDQPGQFADWLLRDCGLEK